VAIQGLNPKNQPDSHTCLSSHNVLSQGLAPSAALSVPALWSGCTHTLAKVTSALHKAGPQIMCLLTPHSSLFRSSPACRPYSKPGK
jgi:hypothetical protein